MGPEAVVGTCQLVDQRSGPLRRPGPGTGAMPRLPAMWGWDSARQALNRRTVPVWFLVVLFAISIGVGLGATLLINWLFF